MRGGSGEVCRGGEDSRICSPPIVVGVVETLRPPPKVAGQNHSCRDLPDKRSLDRKNTYHKANVALRYRLQSSFHVSCFPSSLFGGSPLVVLWTTRHVRNRPPIGLRLPEVLRLDHDVRLLTPASHRHRERARPPARWCSARNTHKAHHAHTQVGFWR